MDTHDPHPPTLPPLGAAENASTLEGRLALELRTAAAALASRWESTGPELEGRPLAIVHADEVVPGVLTMAAEVVAGLEGFAASPPENLKTRSRLGEQLRYRATVIQVQVERLAAGLSVMTPPADIAAALDLAAGEVARLRSHLIDHEITTYDNTEEAAYAGELSATLRGEITGATRVLALLLGLSGAEPADVEAAEVYADRWAAAQKLAALSADDTPAEKTPAGAPLSSAAGYLDRTTGDTIAVRIGPDGGNRFVKGDPVSGYVAAHAHTRTAVIMLSEAIKTRRGDGTPWDQLPLFLADVDDLYAPLQPGEREQIAAASVVVVPVQCGVPIPGRKVPHAALEALARLDLPEVPAAIAQTLGDRLNAAALEAFLSGYRWDAEFGEWWAIA